MLWSQFTACMHVRLLVSAQPNASSELRIPLCCCTQALCSPAHWIRLVGLKLAIALMIDFLSNIQRWMRIKRKFNIEIRNLWWWTGIEHDMRISMATATTISVCLCIIVNDCVTMDMITNELSLHSFMKFVFLLLKKTISFNVAIHRCCCWSVFDIFPVSHSFWIHIGFLCSIFLFIRTFLGTSANNLILIFHWNKIHRDFSSFIRGISMLNILTSVSIIILRIMHYAFSELHYYPGAQNMPFVHFIVYYIAIW